MLHSRRAPRISPIRVRMVVVLPMPLRPISVTTSPAPTVNVTSNRHLGLAVSCTEIFDAQHDQCASSPR